MDAAIVHDGKPRSYSAARSRERQAGAASEAGAETWRKLDGAAPLRFRVGRAAAPERAVGTRLEVGVNRVDIGSDIWIVGESPHCRGADNAAAKHDFPERVVIDRAINQRGGEGRPDAVRPVTMTADALITAVAFKKRGVGATLRIGAGRFDRLPNRRVALGGRRGGARSQERQQREARPAEGRAIAGG